MHFQLGIFGICVALTMTNVSQEIDGGYPEVANILHKARQGKAKICTQTGRVVRVQMQMFSACW
jgi:hypothetical protein